MTHCLGFTFSGTESVMMAGSANGRFSARRWLRVSWGFKLLVLLALASVVSSSLLTQADNDLDEVPLLSLPSRSLTADASQDGAQSALGALDEEYEYYYDTEGMELDAAAVANGTAVNGTQPGIKKRRKKRVAAKKTQVVPLAPEAVVENDGDIDPEGPCADPLEQYCKHVELGEGRSAWCLSNIIAEQELDSTEDKVISDECRKAVYDFKVALNKNINNNIAMAKACKDDALKFCNDTAHGFKFQYKPGSVIDCLKGVKKSLTPKCRRQVFRVQQDAAMDFRADSSLFAACERDASRHCVGVEYGGGRVQECLRNQEPTNITWECRERLFWQEVENSDDIRLSVRLFSRCMRDKKKFCRDITPGNGVVKDCLEDNRNEEGFSEVCRTELENMIAKRVADVRLDSRLKNVCWDDMALLCESTIDMDEDEREESHSSLINCLQDYVSEIKSRECSRMVSKYQQLASEDIRFASNLASACSADRQTYCASVQPGSARVIRCLKKHRTKLAMTCRAQLFDEEVKFSSNIDFQYPMKTACKKEIKAFCDGIPHGNARVIRCLQDRKDEKGFGEMCRAEMKKYEHEASLDYRFNYRLSKACKNDVQALCKGLCTPDHGEVCGGRVLRCLIEKKEDINSEACTKEVAYFEKMQVSDFRNDVILANTCREDVSKFCKSADPDKEPGAVHKCLRDNYKDLSEACRQEELQVEMMENENVELSPNVMKTCKDERALFCEEVTPGNGRVFRCLADSMGDTDFGAGCQNLIRSKLQRRQMNWRLDPPLRKQCKASVAKLCADVDKGLRSQPGAVVHCLVSKRDEVEAGCLKELGRAVHMAFFVWNHGGIITQPCDDDVERLCLASRPNMAATPGAVASCLADVLEHQSLTPSQKRRLMARPNTPAAAGAVELSSQCTELADIAIPPNVKKQFIESLFLAFVSTQLDRLEGTTGIPMLARSQGGEVHGIRLTGWTALVGVFALLLLLLYGATILYRRYKGLPDAGADYTVVLKGKNRPRS